MNSPPISPVTVAVDQISVPKAADVLAHTLREKILKGDLRAGMELPAERELGAQAGLSRATVREALRILEGEGLIETRLGRRGGSTVLQPGTEPIERSVGIFIRGLRIRMESVLQTRHAIEPAAARYAAAHRTDEDLELLEQCHRRLEEASVGDDVHSYVQANLEWHVQVVRSSHNELLIAFITAVSKAVYIDSDIEGFNSPEVRHAVIRAHRRVMDAIRDRDGEAAARRMDRHVHAYIDNIAKATPPATTAKASAKASSAKASSAKVPAKAPAKRRPKAA